MPDGNRQNPPEPTPAGSPHLAQSATGVIASILDYLHARVSLLTFEAQEARSELLGRIICFVACAFFLLIAYATLQVGLIGWLAQLTGYAWPLVTLAFAVLHVVLALLFLAVARRKFGDVPFRDSLQEWEKDRAWLNRHRKQG